MKNESTSLTISVLTSQLVPHYYLVKNNLLLTEIKKYLIVLESYGCPFEYKFGGLSSSLTIHEPHLIPSEISIYNNRYFTALAISDSDIVFLAKQIGDPIFWSYLTEEEIALVKILFGKLNNIAIAKIYFVSDKLIELRIRELLAVLRIKYPYEPLKNRMELRILCETLGVYIPERCSQCKHLI